MGTLKKSISIALLLPLLLISPFSSLFSQTNLISNGDFENGTAGWQVWGAKLESSSDAHSGSLAAKVYGRNNPWDAIVTNITSVVSNGESYTLNVWVKITDPAVDFRATLALNVDGLTTYNGFMWTPSPVIGSYQFYTATIPTSWTGNLISANLYFETAGVGGVYSDYIIDDVEFFAKEKDPEPESIDSIGLKDIVSNMRIGGTVTGNTKNYFNNEVAKAIFLKDCNATNLMCYPAWGRWDETNKHVYHLDVFNSQLKEMKEKNIFVTSHMLLGWDKYFPEWYRNNDFEPDTLEAIMHSWLDAIISKNGNDTLVDIWNVVNESISWDGKGGYWPLNAADQESACELQRMGFEPDASGLTGTMKVNAEHPVYIRKAFEYARTLTNKKLELRETTCEFPGDQKYDAFYQLVVHLKNMGTPIDVIGLQSHLDIGKNYDWKAYENNIKRYRDLGFEINITEVDVGDINKSWTDEKAEIQGIIFYDLITAAIRGGASEINTWGFIDEDSGWRGGESAFQYSNSFHPKPGYFGMETALTDMSHILFWEMDSYENDTVPDVMLNNNIGTLYNFDSPALSSGFKSNAIKFDGVDDHISSGLLSEDISEDLTFSCFVKTSSKQAGIIADLGKEASTGMKIGMKADGIVYLSSEHTGMTADLSGTTAINDGNWHFIAVQRDSVSYILYVDASIAVEKGEGSIETCTSLTIGAQSGGASAFEGIIDEVKLYNTAIEENSFSRSILPFTPVKFTVTKLTTVVIIRWADNSNIEDGYIIERKINDGEWEVAARVSDVTFSIMDTFKVYNASYSYRVKSFNQFGASPPSIVKTVISPMDPTTGFFDNPASDSFTGISVYPNPSGGEFEIRMAGNVKQMSYDVYSIAGNLIKTGTSNSQSSNLNMTDVPKGLYFMKMKSDANVSTIRLVVN